VDFFGVNHGSYLQIMISSSSNESSNEAWIYLDEVNKTKKTPNKITIMNPGIHEFMLKMGNMICCKKEIRIFSNFRNIDFDLAGCNSDRCDYEIIKG